MEDGFITLLPRSSTFALENGYPGSGLFTRRKAQIRSHSNE